jgi:ribosomal protein L7Ae-like RNA K-turn-binding protein
LLSLLGLCRAANAASFGHNAAKAALRERRARLCLLCGDASPRLCEEFEYLAGEAKAPLFRIPATTQDLKQATQYKAAVLTVNGRGFADKITALLTPESQP